MLDTVVRQNILCDATFVLILDQWFNSDIYC